MELLYHQVRIHKVSHPNENIYKKKKIFSCPYIASYSRTSKFSRPINGELFVKQQVVLAFSPQTSKIIL